MTQRRQYAMHCGTETVQHLAPQELAQSGKFLRVRGAGTQAIEIGFSVLRAFVRHVNSRRDHGDQLGRLDGLSHGDSL